MLPILMWLGLLGVGIWAADWGADRMALPFQKLKARFGLSGAAGGAALALVTASPEVGINTAAAVGGLGDIGLGNMLGANIISVPVTVIAAYAATRWYLRHPPNPHDMYKGRAPERPETLQLDRSAITVQALPYLAIVGLIAVLTLPEGWRGLQPVDGWIMLAAFVAFYLQAIFRGRRTGEAVDWTGREIGKALLGVLAVAAGAWLAVTATERIVGILGISAILGGLFISSAASVVPETIQTWVVIRVGQPTAATTSVIGDNAVTMTLGFLPLALVGTEIRDLPLYMLNLGFVFLFGLLFAVVTALANRRRGMTRRHVAVIGGTYLVYVGAVVLLLSMTGGAAGSGR